MRDDVGAHLRKSRDEILDARRASAHLAALINDGSTDCVRRVEVVDAKPGKRYVVRFLRTEGGRPLIGKLYAEPQRAEWAWAAHSAAWQAGLRVPRPVGLVAEFSLVVYEEAPGTPLALLLSADGAEAHLARAGRWLAEFHSASPPLQRSFDVSAEMTNIGEWARLVASVSPCVAPRIQRLAEATAFVASPIDSTTARALHKDFHPGHVLVGDDVTVIDFDEARVGEAEFDLGHFVAFLHLHAWRDPLVARRLVDLERAFVDGYHSAGMTVADPLVRWAQAYTFVKIARQLALGVGVAPHPNGAARHQQIEFAVAAGEVCCGTSVS